MTPSAPPRKSDLDLLVGQAVKAVRLQGGRTLAELSAASGVSTAMISKIERGQVSASLATLDALAGAMDVPLINFLAGTVERGEAALVRAGEGATVRRAGTTYGHEYRQLGRVEDQGQEIESCLITLESPVEGTPVFQHPGIELIHLVSGALTYRVGRETYVLAPGDTLSFQGSLPHGPVQATGGRAVFLSVIARPC